MGFALAMIHIAMIGVLAVLVWYTPFPTQVLVCPTCVHLQEVEFGFVLPHRPEACSRDLGRLDLGAHHVAAVCGARGRVQLGSLELLRTHLLHQPG